MPLRRVTRVLTWALLLGVVAVAGVLWGQGYRLYAVGSASMTPTFGVGDLVVTAPPSGEYTPGDVVTFPSPAGARHDVTTHRVVEVDGALLTTKGDANETVDRSPVEPASVAGEVVSSVPKLGYVVVFFKQPAGIGATMTALLSIMLLWGLFFPDEEKAAAEAATDRRDPKHRRPAPRHAVAPA